LDCDGVAEIMNPQIITTVAAALGMLVALWTIMSNFDKRNGDRFNALEKEVLAVKETLQGEIQNVKETLRGEIQASKETLRAEMLQMRAELKLEIREAGDRRVV
jgi:hypothetical protein